MIKRFAAAAALALLAGAASAQSPGERTDLRVCADPSNLPYSNQEQAGFENKIAGLLAEDMHLRLSYVWFPQVVGFIRNTLGAFKCDLVMGTVSGEDLMANTTAYYHTGYMIVTRAADKIDATNLGAPVFAGKKIGLIARTPPSDEVVTHDLMGQAKAYEFMTDTRYSNPSHDMLMDLVAGRIDVALLWGPIAGYHIKHESLPLKAAFLTADPGGPRLDYHIAMGVRGNEADWRRTISDEIVKNQAKIQDILVSYGVPLLDEQGRPISGK